MHTHYDNLKVSRDAPSEVIRAAYKSLSQKYHPDRHADSEQANRIMRLLNVAYEVLSDPVKRAEHDQWIAAQEKQEAELKQRQAQRAAAQAAARAQARPARPTPTTQAAQASARTAGQAQPAAGAAGRTARAEKKRKPAPDKRGPAAPLARKWSFLLYAGIGAAIVVLLGEWSTPAPSATDRRGAELVRPAAAAQSAASAPTGLTREAGEARYARPSLTPRGLPWPSESGYLPGYPVLGTSGLSTLTVDNSRNRSDVLLKLVAVNGGAPVPVRTSFVRSGSSFTMDSIAPGNYDVRYQSLDTGEIYRSERFVFEEVRETGGTSAGRNVLTLYTVPGKSRSVTITEREFP